MKVFVTYGIGTTKRGCYSVVEGESYAVCRAMIEAACGREFAFDYPEERGLELVAKYGLRLVPIGPSPVNEED